MQKLQKYQVLPGIMAAAFSITALTGCGDTAASSETAETSTAAEVTAETASTQTASATDEAAVQNSFAYIGSQEEAPANETITGTVTAVEGDTISLTIGRDNGQDPGAGQGGEKPEENGQSGGQDPGAQNDSQPPEAQTENADGDNATVTEEAYDTTEDTAEQAAVTVSEDSYGTAEEPAEQAAATVSEDAYDTAEDSNQEKTATLVLADDSVLTKETDDGQEAATVEDIQVDDRLEITFDENGDITAVVIAQAMEMGGGMNGGGMGGGSEAPSSYDAVEEYSEDSTVDGASISSTGSDENAVLVDGDAEVTLSNVTVDRTSDSSTGGDSSSFYGVGAAILGTAGSTYIKDSTVTTDSAGGAGVFAYGDGTVYVSDTSITTTQDTSGGIHAAGGGTLYAWQLAVKTAGESSAAIRSDRGGGTMVVDGGSYESSGTGSPAVYCTADIAVNDATLTATGSEAICMEGLNTIHLFDCDISGDMQDLDQNDTTWNIIVYQSMSGDSEVGESTMQIVGGTLTAKNGGMIYTTNTQCNILLSDVEITYADDSEFFLQCTGNTNARGWGSEGSNGSDCTFTADNQAMQGDIIWDSVSQLDFYMTNGSSLTGAFTDDETWAGAGGSGYANVYISEDSTWTVTGDSTVTALYNAGTIVDEDGKTVTIAGTDGTTYVTGDSAYTITVSEYSETVDLSGAAEADSWENHQVEKPAALA